MNDTGVYINILKRTRVNGFPADGHPSFHKRKFEKYSQYPVICFQKRMLKTTGPLARKTTRVYIYINIYTVLITNHEEKGIFRKRQHQFSVFWKLAIIEKTIIYTRISLSNDIHLYVAV